MTRQSPLLKRHLVLLVTVVAFVFTVELPAVSQDHQSSGTRTIELDQPLGSEGTITFRMHMPKTYRVGADQPKKDLPILRIPGVANLRLHQSDPEPHDPNVIKLSWLWEQEDAPRWKRRFVPKMPGPRTYYVQYSWDAERGVIDAYVDGNPIWVPGVAWDPWPMKAVGDKIVLPESELHISDVRVRHEHVPGWRLQAQVPDEYRGRTPELWGLREDAEPIDVSDRKGELLYSNDLDEPSDIADWPEIEGPGKIKFEDGWMRMWSPGQEGHHVQWVPKDFPDRFVAEWEIKLASRNGLCLMFFAAKGKNGKDIFHPSLPDRDGTFTQYVRGALQAYHISYFAGPNRITSNMRKDGKFYLMDQGPIAIRPDNKVHHVRIVKDGGHIQLQVDGEVYIDYTDDNEERFGPRYHDGKMGFRQMQATEGLYRNFRVWKLQNK